MYWLKYTNSVGGFTGEIHSLSDYAFLLHLRLSYWIKFEIFVTLLG